MGGWVGGWVAGCHDWLRWVRGWWGGAGGRGAWVVGCRWQRLGVGWVAGGAEWAGFVGAAGGAWGEATWACLPDCLTA